MKKKIISFLLCVLLVVSMIPGTVYGAGEEQETDGNDTTTIDGLHKVPVIPNKDSDKAADKLVLNKILKQDDDGNLNLYLESYATGSFKPKPTEIVIVVDQSGSMYSAVDPNTYWQGYDAFKNNADTEKGETQGYYAVMTDRPGVPDSDSPNDRPYAIALVRYKNGVWQRSQQVVIPKKDYVAKTTGGSVILLENDSMWSNIEQSDYQQFRDEQACFFKTIKGATIDGLNAFLDKIEGMQSCKVAVVGFASRSIDIKKYQDAENYLKDPSKPGDDPANKGSWQGWKPPKDDDVPYRENYGGTGVYNGSEFVLKYQADEETYQNAFKSVSDSNEFADLTASIHSLNTNFWNTTSDAGIQMANEIFKQSELLKQPEDEEPNRIVVMFTDGIPDRSDSDYDLVNVTQAKNKTIEEAKKTKAPVTEDEDSGYGAKVYAFGSNNINNVDGIDALDFLKQVSSSAEDENAYGIAGNEDDLVGFFSNLGQQIYNNSIGLDEGAVLQDIVSSSFVINDKIAGGVEAWRVPCIKDEEGNLSFVDLDDWRVTPIQPENVKVDKSTNTIKVDGFNYQEDIIKEDAVAGSVDGAKLVVKVPIVLNDAYTGDGNGISTNVNGENDGSGIYDKDGNKVSGFQNPQVDPFTKVTVKKTIVGNKDDGKFPFEFSYWKVTGYTDDLSVKENDEDNSQGGNYLKAVLKEKTDTDSLGDNDEHVLEKVKVGSKLTITETPDDEYTTSVIVDGVPQDVGANGAITIEQVTPNMEIEYVNTYKYADLTIQKTGADTTLDQDQTFIFHVAGSAGTATEDIDMQVVVKGNGKITIKDLPVGDYTITEEGGWSWRYTVNSVTAQAGDKDSVDVTGVGDVYSVNLPVENMVVTFNNNRTDEKWLDGNSHCQNIFKQMLGRNR